MISVVIPAYNRARTIERSIRSVLDQTFRDIEVIVVDDCSTDDTEGIVTRIGDERVRYDRLPVNSGACVARNRGVELAKGDYIAFQDSDDEWLPQKLQAQMDALRENNADICFCALRRHYLGDNAKCAVWPAQLTQSSMMDHVVLRRKSVVSTQTIVAKRKVFDDVLFDPKLVKSQDYDWMIRASELYRVFFLAAPLVEQYYQKDSISMTGYEKFVVSREIGRAHV